MFRNAALFISLILPAFLVAQQPSPQDQLEQGLDAGDVKKMTAAVKAGANPNYLLGRQSTYGNLAKVKALVAAGADVNFASRGGWTALMGAADEGKLDIVKYLVSQKADVNAKTRQGRTAAIRAAYHDRAEIIRFLLSKGAKVNEADANGVTALMLAAQRHNEHTVKALLDAGADRSLKTPQNKTALTFAKETVESYEKEITSLNENSKKNPQYEKYNKESIERYKEQISKGKRVVALLSGAEKKGHGKLIGKVFSADGKKIVVTGKGISELTAGSKLTIKTSEGEISATVTEILHSKAKATAKKAGAEKGDSVYLAR